MTMQNTTSSTPHLSNNNQQSRHQNWKKSRWMLLLLIAICIAPVVASYLSYYVFKPRGEALNYGALIKPQRPIPPSLIVKDEKGEAFSFNAIKGFEGKWIMLSVDNNDCGTACAEKLYYMRQIRTAQGKERERVALVWLRGESVVVPAAIRDAYSQTHFLTTNLIDLANWLPIESGASINDNLYLVDPSGHLMMRFPKNPDPSKIKKDLTKLLKWNR